ncbi:DUF6221 family protein [Streptomyces spectabilis]|uniref:DUF6221 family protein n=1 Tax=Streptomyces spectabilis TaxID=68270 RepID=UPI00340FAF85
MDDLVQWLRAQLDEDERIARAASDGPWRSYTGPEKTWLTKDDLMHPVATWHHMTGAPVIMTAMWADSNHIAEWNPARVLCEIDAKRQALGATNADCPEGCQVEHAFSGSCALRSRGPAWEEDGRRWVRDERGARTEAPPVFPAWAVRLLALPYADRPGYREEWRP